MEEWEEGQSLISLELWEGSSGGTLFFKDYLQETENGSGSLRLIMGLTDPSAPCCLSKSGTQKVPEEGALVGALAGSLTGRQSHSRCISVQSS